MINKYQPQDMEGVIRLWNRAAVKLGYKEMNPASFSAIITGNPYFSTEYAFVLREKEEVAGFACGCVGDDLPLGKTGGYITCVLLEEQYENTENYGSLLDLLEKAFVKAGRIHSEILFFNPMMLPWYIKGTKQHEHNNAPGIFKSSRLYQELLQKGYAERATEWAMYINLEEFTIPEKILQKEIKAADEGYEAVLFHKDRHHELVSMLQKLDNPLWEKEIFEASEEGKPFLVAARSGKAVGFAGPIRRQESGRGYFTGIGVNKEHEGHGLGTILFYKLCEEEKKAGADYMSLYTGATNPAAKIYLQAGFKIVEEFAVMRKELQPES